MGMSNYILDCEENFWDKVVDIIKESETIVEATTKAMELWKKEVPHLDEDDVFGQVEDYWNDFWSNYIQRGYNMIDYEAYRFFENEDGIRDPDWSRGLGDVYKRQHLNCILYYCWVYTQISTSL